MSNRVIHFEIQADDIERAKKFYSETLGWRFELMMSKENGGMDYWGIDTGEGPGINGGLYSRSDGDNKYYLYDCTIMVEDIDKAIADIKTKGGTITKEKYEIPDIGFFAGGLDTEGNRFGLMQATKWQPK